MSSLDLTPDQDAEIFGDFTQSRFGDLSICDHH